MGVLYCPTFLLQTYYYMTQYIIFTASGKLKKYLFTNLIFMFSRVFTGRESSLL